MDGGVLDLGSSRLDAGEGRRFDLAVELPDLELGGNLYAASAQPVPVRLEASRTLGNGWAFHLTAEVGLSGPCTRCLGPAAPKLSIDAREVDRPGGGEELDSPYFDGEQLDVAAWLRDSAVLALPVAVLCDPNCPGLCEECGIRLADAGPDHRHEKAPDPRWAALRDLHG